MIGRITTELSKNDSLLFKEWFVTEIGQRYPLSTDITADWLLDLGKRENDPVGYFTLRKAIWKVENQQGNTIGFTVASEKRGGSVKFGPTLVARQERNKGVGRALRLAVEARYQAQGFRKAYSTTNLRNAAGIYYLIAIGYSIEGHFRSHYQFGVDEVVLGKLLAQEGRDIAEQSCKATSVLLERLQPYYDGLDETFAHSIFRSSTTEVPLHDESLYTTKAKVLFGNPAKNFCVTTPKREGTVKVGPVLALDPAGLKDLIGEVVEFYGALAARKLYCIIPFAEAWMVRELRLEGWDLEGALREPYRAFCDMAVLSFFLENGQ